MKTMRLVMLILLAAAPAFAADSIVTPGEGGQAWTRGKSPDNGSLQRMSQATVPGTSGAEFDNLTEGAVREVVFQVNCEQCVLERVVMYSTDCANCDIHIYESDGTVGQRTIFLANGAPDIASETIFETGVSTTYSQYLNVIVESPATPALVSATGMRSVVVAILNNDAEATNNEDVGVRLYWRSE